MLTLITGTPGAGKSLHAVWEFARKVPGSTVESNGQAVPRRLLSNIKNLLLEHEHITAEDLDKWHTWAKPGDVILFDEVQEVWRPRGLGSKVPECIAALETHRHLGVDIVLVTQHPMLVDPNIRRLVNQHIHLRRLSKTVAYIYEWDHCANPGQIKTSMSSRVWFHPKQAYALYKSAQLHTKPTARIPRIALVGLAALIGLGVMGPMAYGRITERFQAPQAQAKATNTPHAITQPTPAQEPVQRTAAGLPAPALAPASLTSFQAFADTRPLGCIAMPTRCECFDGSGLKVSVSEEICREASYRVGTVASSSGSISSFTPVPPRSPEGAAPGVAAAAPMPAASSPAGTKASLAKT